MYTSPETRGGPDNQQAVNPTAALEADIKDQEAFLNKLKEDTQRDAPGLSAADLTARMKVIAEQSQALVSKKQELTKALIQKEQRLRQKFEGGGQARQPDFAETVMVSDNGDDFSNAVTQDTLNTSGGGLLGRIDRYNDSQSADQK